MNNEIITARDPEIVAAEIRLIRDQAGKMLLTAAIQIGERLNEAKSMLPHGEWGRWLEESVSYSQSTANNMMRLANEYGDNQETLFKKVENSQAFADLSYSQALALLDVPADQRAEFAAENNAAEMSTRELRQAIKDLQGRNEELEGDLERTKKSGHNAMGLLTEQKREAQDKYQEAKGHLEAAQAEVHRLTVKNAEIAEEKARLDGLLQKADAEMEKLEDQLQEAKEHPEIPEAQLTAIRKEAEAAAASKEAKKVEKKLRETDNKLKETQKALAEAEAKAEEARLQAQAAEEKAQKAASASKMSSPAVAVFQEAFGQSQQVFGRLVELWRKMQTTDPESAACCHQALEALVEKLRGDIS